MDQKIEKRKVDFTTLEEPIAGTSKKTKSDDSDVKLIEINSNEILTKYLESFTIFDDKLSPYYFANELIHTFIQIVVKKVSSFKVPLIKLKSSIVNLINALQKLKQSKIKFFNHSTFRELLKAFADDIKKSKSIENVFDHLTELTTELSRISQTVKTDEIAKNVDIVKKIKVLTNAINRISEQISKAENATISADDMGHNTHYTKLPLLYKSVIRLWKKRELLRNQSDNSGRIMFKLFKYNGTSNLEVNAIIEKYFINFLQSLNKSEETVLDSKLRSKHKSTKSSTTKSFEFFTIIDLKNHLQKQLNKLDIEDFVLSDELLEKIYKDLLLESKDRRLKQQTDAFKSIQYLEDIQPESFPDDRDPKLVKQIEENEQKATESLHSIIEEFRKKDYDLNGKLEGDQIGWDDNGEDEDDDDDDDDEDDDQEDEADDQEGKEEDNDSPKVEDKLPEKVEDKKIDDQKGDSDDDVILCED